MTSPYTHTTPLSPPKKTKILSNNRAERIADVLPQRLRLGQEHPHRRAARPDEAHEVVGARGERHDARTLQLEDERLQGLLFFGV